MKVEDILISKEFGMEISNIGGNNESLDVR